MAQKEDHVDNSLFVEHNPKQAQELVGKIIDKQGKTALQAVSPVAIAVQIDPEFDPAEQNTLLEQSVLISPIVNPLFDAIMINNGGRRTGQRTYAFSLSRAEGGSRQKILQALEAIPSPIVCRREEMQSAHKRGSGSGHDYNYNIHTIAKVVYQSSLFNDGADYYADQMSVRQAIECGEEKFKINNGAKMAIQKFAAVDDQEQFRHLEHSIVSLAQGEGRGQLYIKVASNWVAHRGFETETIEEEHYKRVWNINTRRYERKQEKTTRELIIPHKGVYFWEGAENLNRMKPQVVDQPVSVTPAQALAMLETAKAWGFPIVSGRKVNNLLRSVRDHALVERQPASPGLARVVVGKNIDSNIEPKLQERLRPLNHRKNCSLQVIDVNALEASKIIKQLPAKTIIDHRVEDVINMLNAEPDDQAISAYPLREDQFEAVALHRSTKVGFLNASDVGFGKGHPHGTKILTPEGYQTIETLQVGDSLIGSNGQETKLTGFYQRGELPVYEIRFSDKSKVRCDGDHLWNVRQSGATEYKTMQTREIIKAYKQQELEIPLCQAVDFADSTIEQRKEKLQFLLSKQAESKRFITLDDNLCAEVQMLVQSLGGTAEPRNYGLYICLPADISFEHNTNKPRRVIESIEYVGHDQVICLQVAAEDRLYLTENCIVTHNTVTTAQAQREDAQLNPGLRSLIIVQSSMRTQWQEEFELWFPEAKIFILEGNNIKQQIENGLQEADNQPAVFLTTRETMRKHPQQLTIVNWDELVIDEAAFIDSSGSQQTKAAWKLRKASTRGIALTGTPIERSLDNIGRILAWCRNEEKIFHGNRLSQRFDMSIPDDVDNMWDALGPTVFRRDQSEFAEEAELPPVETEVLKYHPSDEEKELAAGATTELRKLLLTIRHKASLAQELPEKDPRRIQANEELRKIRGAVLGGVTLARQAASDPAALADSSSTGVELLQAGGLIEPAIEHGGSKRAKICPMVENMVKQDQEAVLIFTDFSTVAKTIAQQLQSSGIQAATFTGKDSRKKRDQAKADFMAGKIDVLILTNTGREGHNLQRASVLIHYDLPWLPSQVIQRIGRARRHGSSAKRLKVLIPIMIGTIEERVAALLVPRAVEASIALDAHRGIKGGKTSAGMAVGGLADATDISKADAKQQSLFKMAEEILELQ